VASADGSLGVGVGVGVGVGFGVEVGVGADVGGALGLGVDVGVGADVGVGVAGRDRVGLGRLAVGLGSPVRVGSTEGRSPPPSPHETRSMSAATSDAVLRMCLLGGRVMSRSLRRGTAILGERRPGPAHPPWVI